MAHCHLGIAKKLPLPFAIYQEDGGMLNIRWAAGAEFHPIANVLFIEAPPSRDIHRVRRFSTADGNVIIERLMKSDQVGRSYTYAIVQSPLPITNYVSKLSVKEINGGANSSVEWVGEFTAAGVSDTDAAAAVMETYNGG